jgi:hypothetical protein
MLIRSLDDAVSTTRNNSAIGKAIKDEIEKFSQDLPAFMNVLEQLKSLHPFIGGEFSRLYDMRT